MTSALKSYIDNRKYGDPRRTQTSFASSLYKANESKHMISGSE